MYVGNSEELEEYCCSNRHFELTFIQLQIYDTEFCLFWDNRWLVNNENLVHGKKALLIKYILV